MESSLTIGLPVANTSPQGNNLFYAVVDCANASETLFHSCTPATLLTIGRTCRFARVAAGDYFRRNFDINKHLEPFFADVLQFRVLQAKTDCVISGSNALQYMGRVNWTTSDLDLFVKATHAQVVSDWLTRESGVPYRFMPTTMQEEIELKTPEQVICRCRQDETSGMVGGPCSIDVDFSREYGSIQVLNFVDTSNHNKKIQVIVTKESPIDCILSFHSSKCSFFSMIEN